MCFALGIHSVVMLSPGVAWWWCFVVCVGLVVLCFLNIAVVWYGCGLGCVGIVVLLCGGW